MTSRDKEIFNKAIQNDIADPGAVEREIAHAVQQRAELVWLEFMHRWSMAEKYKEKKYAA